MPNISRDDLTRRVKAQALRLGLTLAGVSSAAPLDSFERYRRWLRAGHHGAMDYLARSDAVQRRADPRAILPECRSVLSVAMSCNPGEADEPPPPGTPRIARYARGEDYHNLLPDLLRELVRFMEREVGHPIPHRVYTDTGPLLERELAQRSGLGWIGRNSCLINPHLGSHLLLGEVLLGVDLTPDAPFAADRCGSCQRCVQACPTGCILPNRTIDARRCISYLTIELKDSIPQDLRPSIGDWLFGCDICQDVCPWNERFARPTQAPAFQPRPFLSAPRLEAFLALRPGAWRAPLRDSPLERPRRRGLVRNAAVVAGNQRAAHLLPALADLLQRDPEPLVRAHAAWALGQIGSDAARRALAAAAEGEANEAVRREISRALPDSPG